MYWFNQVERDGPPKELAHGLAVLSGTQAPNPPGAPAIRPPAHARASLATLSSWGAPGEAQRPAVPDA